MRGLGLLAVAALFAGVQGNYGMAAEGIHRLEPSASEARSGAVVVINRDQIQTTQLFPRVAGTTSAVDQLDDVLKQLDELLTANGSSCRELARLNLYVARTAEVPALTDQLKLRLATRELPAITWVNSLLPNPEHAVAIDAIAVRAPSGASTIVDPKLPGVAIIPAGATSRAYVSGQAEKGDGSMADATRLTMGSLVRTLTFLNMKPADVVQVKAFVDPISDSEIVLKEIRAVFAEGACPPVSLVRWKSPSLPIEIELVAATTAPVEEGRPVVEYLTPPGMTASPVYCRVARVQSKSTIYLSGLYGSATDPDSEEEMRDLFAQTRRLVEAAGSDMNHLVKATYYVSSNGSNKQHNALRPQYYDPSRPPAASKALVDGVGREGRTFTWDMIAVPVK